MNPFKIIKSQITFHKGIVVPSFIFIASVSLVASFFPKISEQLLENVKQFLFVNMNWLYVMAVTVFVLFLIFLVFSKYGNTRLGTNDSKPEYSFFSWVSMLFAAGMGIGLMYFSVSEPISHYSDPAFMANTEVQRAKDAQLFTFFHWGIHAWAIYGVVGLSLAYFAYRYKLPLSLRSCFYPMLKDKINGRAGNIIDMFALCSTFFGITTSLGLGVMQLNAGLVHLGVLPDTGFVYQTGIVVFVMLLSILSATSGVSRGVKRLSQINIVAAVLLMLFVLILGPTVYLLGTFSEGLGNYINQFFSLTFNTHAFEPGTQPWYFDWTVLYWAWWISWSPYVGLFIARISKGRTIREFIGAVLLIPTLFNFVWMTVFGNSAVWFDRHEAAGALSALAAQTDTLMFKFFEYLPLQQITNSLVIFIIFIFFVTSADSGILVMNSIATKNAKRSPKWQLVFWGIMLGLLALLLLNAGGLQSLQAMTLITALPFAIIMLFFCYNLVQGLVIDNGYYQRDFSHSTNGWSGDMWKSRLRRILSYKDKSAVNGFLRKVVLPGFNELAEELESENIIAEVRTLERPFRVEIVIAHDAINDFKYGVRTQPKEISESLIKEENTPDIDSNKIYIPQTYFGDSRDGYDIQYYTKNEIISDVLKQYERFLSLTEEQKNEIFIGVPGQ